MFSLGDGIVALAVALAIAALAFSLRWSDVECARAGLEQRKVGGSILWVKP
jgi:hypothetical protein